MNMVGQTISHYEIIEKLGGGGMGVVYKARDLKLARFVALKFLNKELLADEESRIRFINEAKAISSLDHPNIATIHEIDEVDEVIFISMGYYEGQALTEYMTAKGPLSIDEICSIGIQIANGLSKAHDSGIIHRDIKPANIMVLPDAQVKILDFGLAKVVGQTVITRQDSVVGTAAYMSPEQVQGETVDHRTDIFSFGVLLYEMLTGERPFKGDFSASIAYAIVNEVQPPLQRLRPETPQPFQRLVGKALEKKKENRCQSAEEIARELQGIRGGGSEVSQAVRPRYQFPVSKRILIPLGGILILAFAAILFFAIWLNKSDTPKITTVAIMPFVFEGAEADWKWLGGAMTELLNTNLAQDPTFRVLDAQKRRRVMSGLGFREKNLSFAQALQIARKAKAGKLVVGSLQKTGDQISAKAKIYDSVTGTLVIEFEPLQGTHRKLYELANQLSYQIADNISLTNDRSVGKLGTRTTVSLDAFRYFIEGKDAALDKRYRESIEELKKAIDLDSTFIEPYYWLAYAYSESGHALKSKQVLAKGKPYISQLSQKERLTYLSNEAGFEERWNDYAGYLEQLLRIDPLNAFDQARYGWTQYKKFRKLDAGIRAMEKSVALDSSFGWVYNTLGYAYLEKGDPQKALEMIEKYVALKPAYVDPLDSKAEILTLIGQYAEAIANCERILAIQPDHQHSRIRLARAYSSQGKYSQALEALQDYMRLVSTPKFKSIGQSLMAETFFLQGKLPEAAYVVEQAIVLDSTNLEAHWIRGRILLRAQDRPGVKNELAALERGLLAQGGLDGRWLWYHLKGETALQDKSFEHAIAEFQKALDLRPKDRSFYLSALASAYEQAGQLQNAVLQYGSALTFNPNHALAAFAIARVYEQLGNFAAAKRAYGKVLEIWSGADDPINELEIAKRRLTHLSPRAKNH